MGDSTNDQQSPVTFDSSERSRGSGVNFDNSDRSRGSASGSNKKAAPARELPGKRSSSSLISNRDNCDYKWQRARGVVGALEVNCEPDFKYKDDLLPRYSAGREAVFEDALNIFNELKLRDSFVRACDDLPWSNCCCGLIKDTDATIRDFVPLLNDGWAKSASKQLMTKGLKVDIFLWNWQNASGKAETNILLIRFFELSSYRLRRASNDDDFDVSDMMSKDELSKVMEEDSKDLDESDDFADGKPQKEEMAR